IYSSPDWSSRWQLEERPSYLSYFDDWSDDTDSYYQTSGGDYVTEGYAQTDDSGEAIVSFNTPPIVPDREHPYGDQYLDKRYRIECEVTDISRMSVVSSGYCSVTSGNFALFVTPSNYVTKSGEPISVDFSAIDYDRKPVANQPVTLKLVRWI